ncbi:glutathione S-transferase U8 [Beta vulgaris subsp. vulgaris]|uniref:glutathione S-transferase U8 n=1 Tax=Beta vulgaris subsp. vulgaris TaxID=3555 RepID=UPI002036DED7|nr:glutathione S-transferase U8 [Beta vulgaris subsp. vulgaris]
MGDPEMKLLGLWCSPYSKRVEIALCLKGLAYDYIEEDVQNKSPELLKYNPVHKKVPVLVRDGKPVAESLVILEYIDEMCKDKPSILPEHPYERAMARFWARFIDEKCLPSIWRAFWGPENEQESAGEEARNNLKILEKELKGNKFFGGTSIGYLDIVANFIAYWLDAIQKAAGKEILTKELFPLLSKWKDDFVACKVVKQNLPPWERLVAYYQIRNEAAKAARR